MRLRVAVARCRSALAGYNATIFAYGQTGSGKTFTITGGAERYQDRGIIPRALTYMYNEFKRVRAYERGGCGCKLWCFLFALPCEAGRLCCAVLFCHI